ncbi:MAG: RNase III inhibitor, partial [Myxococcales bacterium]|nr:RNase III inhibitor [Myxococcales bacterium]
HTVGPVYRSVPNPAELLADAYRNSLQLAEEHGLRSIAFPAISTGVYGYPREEAAAVVRRVLDEFPYRSLQRVVLCFFSAEYREIAARVFG